MPIENNLKWNSVLILLIMFGFAGSGLGQEDSDIISTVVIDSAPKKLYSELYSDENGNQFMVEIYEEPQEGENLIHFRSFKNGKIIGRKSQALADAHNFSFYIDETEERLMREDSAQLLYEVLKKLMEESDQKLKSNLEDMFDEEEIADQLTKKLADPLSEKIRTPDDQIESMAMSLAIKLTQKERLVAAKIPPYQELITQVSDSNMQQDYEKTIEILDEDIANRTPDEQRKALKISGLMSVLVASKKLKRAISTIEDYDLPDDPELRQVSEALSDWLSKNLVIE